MQDCVIFLRCASMAPGSTRLGPGYQLKTLVRVCSSRRFRTLVSKRYSGWGGKIPSLVGLAECRYCTEFAYHVGLPRCGCIRHHPVCITVSYGRDVVVNARDLRVRVTKKKKKKHRGAVPCWFGQSQAPLALTLVARRAVQALGCVRPKRFALHLFLDRASMKTAA